MTRSVFPMSSVIKALNEMYGYDMPVQSEKGMGAFPLTGVAVTQAMSEPYLVIEWDSHER